ncbi:glycoside hydrolase family 16 protein [Cytophagaceae bacterium DM2B3-1]|uniref:Glycoside hydrolase family 16 protein n=1 Tax=Xanthocytophaga flava TaxID=3048013 RepID=A0ABT7CPW0_9BACT|nr:glycoside hydrolase family 16 protein [Xanthocytophaga flavus]MDJ1495778.1 glycoside hydrolase family 16 protein [Xanthocytophaga flavus]
MLKSFTCLQYGFPTLILFIGLLSCKKESLVHKKGYQLVWSDEFEYKGLPDPARWGYGEGGNGWGNHELQYYTRERIENAHVENGVLRIEARKEKFNQNEYTSARLHTKGKGDWMYGRIDVKAKLPSGKGTWPAIWMLASTTPLKWPDDGELDIMEHVGYDQGVIHANIHTKAYNHTIGTNKGNQLSVSDVSSAFHVYSMEWDEEKITFFIDDKSYFTFTNDKQNNSATWPYNQKFHLLLNIAIGGDWGGKEGVDTSIFPQTMEVDYVRVYQKK